MIKRIWQFFFPLRDSAGDVHPGMTLEMFNRGTVWALLTDAEGTKEWREVCKLCHGNCGQCGLTGRIGNISVSLDAIVENGGWDSGNHAGLPRG